MSQFHHLNSVKQRWQRWANRWRQRLVSALARRFLGYPVNLVPQGQAGTPLVALAGAVVFWYLENGFKQFIMVRTPEHTDGKSRFPSCFGMGAQPDVGQALGLVVRSQLGAVFATTLGADVFAPNRVASAPMFSMANDQHSNLPVQTLVWVVQVQPAQAELLAPPAGVTPVIVPEFSLNSAKISPTHRALYESAQRHLPKTKVSTHPKPDETDVEASIKDAATPRTRVLH